MGTNFGGCYYKLDKDHNLVECSRDEWSKEYEDFPHTRRVAMTDLPDNVGISTVFLGLDHGFRQYDKPIVFETMVFGGPLDGEMERYATWDEAVAGHQRMVERCKQGVKDDGSVLHQ